jgi:hypothetical protein
MTVVSTFIYKDKIGLASDSLLSWRKNGQNVYDDDRQKSKLVRYEQMRAAACYWGLAKYNSWNMHEWLRKMGMTMNNQNIEALGILIRDELTKLFHNKNINHGIGIHLVGYEDIAGYRIPELFLISNYKDPNYNKLEAMNCTRQTYHILTGDTDLKRHGEKGCRLAVKERLDKNNPLVFNNGDPQLFNPVAFAIYNMLRIAIDRKVTTLLSDEQVCHIARRPVEFVAKFQRDFFNKKQRSVGGKLHDLCINAKGTFLSTTGD